MALELESKDQISEAYANFLKDKNVKRFEILSENPNIFEVLKAQKFEIRHSNFLAWLFDPHGNHGLGDQVLKEFLIDLSLDSRSNDFSIFEINDLDFSKVVVEREWFNIDILIQFPNLIITIENKIESGEQKDQLKKYRELVQKRFPEEKKIFVFLNPFGFEPSSEHYINYTYEPIINYLEDLLEYNQALLARTRVYITDYIENMKNNIMQNGGKTELASKIYRDHKDLLDFIFENKSNQLYEVREYVRNKILEKGMIIGSETKPCLRFLTKDLDMIIPKGVGKSWKYGEAFLFEVYFNASKNIIYTFASISPSGENIKKPLITILKNSGVSVSEESVWTSFYGTTTDAKKFKSFTQDGQVEELGNKILEVIDELVKKVEPIFLEHKEQIIELKENTN